MGRPEPVITTCEACDARVVLSGVSVCVTEGLRVCLWCALNRCAPRGHEVQEPPFLHR